MFPNQVDSVKQLETRARAKYFGTLNQPTLAFPENSKALELKENERQQLSKQSTNELMLSTDPEIRFFCETQSARVS